MNNTLFINTITFEAFLFSSIGKTYHLTPTNAGRLIRLIAFNGGRFNIMSNVGEWITIGKHTEY